ncbi:MAG: fructose-6-phosphate aldolase [Selenomonas sp.]|uniref:fructose-6-phosphate aldolase n=1 Tax=Selenomonas sp. TaxID=2053611 RepID=UPI001CAC05AE|nr:fructose-6-phosphate aldolase [Selenomonas sp.]MBF1691832.1 fructose-6-phosphate aldolase [Selenomonas sp.]MBF1694322.1 fructose-6-phosphate aldolase [Selenomonas sp.]
MKYLIDSANLDEIRALSEYLPIAGVTSNPSIVKKEGSVPFFAHMREIRSIIGNLRPLHIQVTATDYDGMMRDAEAVFRHVDEKVFIKVPVDFEGVKVIKALRRQGANVTATAVYGMDQAFMALEAGADCIAPYYNRMEALGVDAASVIGNIAGIIAHYGYETEILAASFKQPAQIDRAILAGAHSVTVAPDVLRGIFAKQVVADAVQAFSDDWTGLYGGKTLAELSDE